MSDRQFDHIDMQILVLGMPRSGASVVARLLTMMGVYCVPERLSTGANQENPEDFGERRDVRALNDMVLRAAGADWHVLGSFSLDRVPAPSLDQFREEAAKITLAMDACRPWFLKELRLCVLAPLWLELLEMPICIFVHRSPLKIARSLQVQNGFSLTFGLALWERYYTAALNATLGRPRIQVNHADLIADPIGPVRRLAKELEAMGVRGLRAPSDKEIRAFIDPLLDRGNEEETGDLGQLSKSQTKLRNGFETGKALRATEPISFSQSAQDILDLHDRAVKAQKKVAELGRVIKRRDSELAEQREKNRILKDALDTIEELFGQLRASRGFHFAIYTARRFGLVSRNPRRWVEAIKDQFPRTRKALKQVGKPPQGGELSVEQKMAHAVSLRTAASARNALAVPEATPPENASVCFIILHRAGEHHLRNLFNSFLKVNTFAAVEFSVVLHACTDASREVIDLFRDRLRIKVTDCPENLSFACSNNRAAEQSNADYLVFLNNDVIFQEDITLQLLRCLQDSRNGLAGLRLLFPPDDPNYPLGLQHAGIKFRPDPLYFFHRPFNLGVPVYLADTPRVLEKFPAVTAAVVACRRRDFLAVGGFCEDYLYGYEDVDLGLTFRRLLGQRSVSANYLTCIHNESATGRLDETEAVLRRRANNIRHLIRRHGWYLRRQIVVDKMAGNLFFSDKPLTLAFAVSEATPVTATGDFFTASELGEACAKEFGWNIRYLSRKDDWYDLKDVDVLIVLLDGYELSKMRGAKPDLLKVAWLRNWFERWASRPEFDQYDLFLCSSVKSARWLRDTQRKPAWIFPLATNPDRFSGGQLDSRFMSDYCFTGSYWRLEREIESAVQPQKLEGYKFAVFGRGWDAHPSFGAHVRGFFPYSEMPNVYASTRIVVDDANHVTKNWGSVNSRVFDALAAGALVITNGEAGAAEVFDGKLPTYRSPEELQSLLRRYLGAEAERRELVARLRQRVLSDHTYRHRARTLKRILITRARRGYRIAIKIGAPTRSQIQHWGDYHFALSLGRCFAEQGHAFRIDCIDEWERPESFGDDVVIVLRGLSRYRPKPGQINLMWNISHPDKVHDDEYKEFDHVFVASRVYAADLARRFDSRVSALLQCTDPYIFYPDPNPAVVAEKMLFVGNSRKQYREVVRFAVEAQMPIAVYGTHWTMFIPVHHIRGEYIDNSVLRQHYSRCDILLNDHWPSMLERGFISNRLFDAAAAGAFVISDAVEGGTEVFGEDLVAYQSESEFHEKIEYYLAHPEERREKARRLRKVVLERHTFADRAVEISRHIRELDSLKQSGETLRNVAAVMTYA